MKADYSVIFCATQRTGSTMIFNDFRDVVGACDPVTGEILYNRIISRKTERPWMEVWADVGDKNRVYQYFTDKVMFHYTASLSRFIERGSTAGTGRCLKFVPELFDGFYNFFADAIWVYIDRRDVFAQAVSMYLAQTTKVWHKKGEPAEATPPAPLLDCDYEKLKGHVNDFLAEKEQWQAFFRHYKITPIRIDYEDAAPGYPHYLTELLARTGLQMVDSPPPRELSKLGGELNQKMAELLRYASA